MTDLVLRFPGASVRSHIRLERGGLARLGAFTKRTTAARHVVLVTDPRVARFHGESALASLRRAGLAVDTVMVPAGEGAKRATVLARLWDAFSAAGLARDGAVVALGGGVHRVTMPLPWALDHVHCYAVEDPDGWTVVDAGLGTRPICTVSFIALAAIGGFATAYYRYQHRSARQDEGKAWTRRAARTGEGTAA